MTARGKHSSDSTPMAETRSPKRRRVDSSKDRPSNGECASARPHSGLSVLRSIACEKLCGKRPTPHTGSSEAHAKVENLLRQTVDSGEGNSMLVIGPRSSNASQVVRDALRKLSIGKAEAFHVVWLNGAIHTDDKLAVREIWRQLGREMELGEDEDQSKSHSDTLAKLLATLSHAPLEEGGQTSRSVIFVLKEFDLFTYHSRQTLLYNLFDIAQSSRTPIAVLGLTTNVNVVDMLEKRVKSRFSQRHVFLPRPASLDSFMGAIRGAMQIQQEELEEEDLSSLDQAARNEAQSSKCGTRPNEGDDETFTDTETFVDAHETLEEVTQAPKTPKGHRPRTTKGSAKGSAKSSKRETSPRKPDPPTTDPNATSPLLLTWNTHISTLFSTPELKTFLTREYHTTKSLPTAYTTLAHHLTTTPLPTTSSSSPPPPPPASTTPPNLHPLHPPLTPLSALPTLPTLALTLLICAARLDILTASPLCNLHMAHAEYTALATRSRVRAAAHTGRGAAVAAAPAASGIVWSVGRAAGAWDVLVQAGLVTPVVGGGGRGGVRAGEMCRVEVRLEEVEGAMRGGLERGLREWVREL